jgi:hypothetical protein
MIKKLKKLFKIPVLFSMAGIFFFTAKAEAVKITDYDQLSNLNKYYLERLQSQSRIVSGDLEYVKGAITKFDSLNDRIAKLRSAAARCRERLASKELDVCTVIYAGRNISIEEAEQRAKELEAKVKLCKKYKEQAVMDERQLSLRLKEIDTIAKDLEEWKRANDEAVMEALQAAGEFIFGQFVSYCADQAASASALKGWLARYDQQLVKEGLNPQGMSLKLQEIYNSYLTAQVTAFTGKTLKATDPIAAASYLTNTASAVVVKDSEASASAKELFNNPTVQKYLQKDKPALVAFDRLVQVGSAEILKRKNLLDIVPVKGISKKLPVVAVTILIRDTGYSGLKWWLSFKNITMRYDLSEKSATSVKALHSLIERRKTNWEKCF